jgi:von Willebrand factor type A domain
MRAPVLPRIFAFLLAALVAGSAAAAVTVRVDSPTAGGVVESELFMAELEGLASAAGADAQGYDVMIVMDVSKSTENASGADVDEDGVLGEDPHLGLYAPGEYPDDVRSTDPEDTVLHAEVRAAETLLAGLDAKRVRVGLVTFSGEVDPATGRQKSSDQRDATLQVPLTQDYAQVRAALRQVLARGPHGATNFAAGLRLATQELAGLSGAVSKPRPGAKPVVLFLTDGVPSFPAGQATVEDPGDLEAAVAAARVAQSAGIRINTYAVGPDALAKPKAATEVARVTLGTYTPVVEPGAIAAALQATSFANVEDVGVVNLTTQESAPDVRLNPDGSFQAFVPVREGKNRVLVNVLASDGSEANLEIEFVFQRASKKGLDRTNELAQIRKLNDELIRHLEAEKIKRARREQRIQRELEIRIEPPAEPSSLPSGR